MAVMDMLEDRQLLTLVTTVTTRGKDAVEAQEGHMLVAMRRYHGPQKSCCLN